MARDSIIWGILVMGCAVQALSANTEDNPPEYMSREERESLKEEARDMFYHAYNAYMDNAYPADELMPLSCKGRYRGSEPDRGDIDSTLGNFSLTLVDTLDTLVVLGDLEEFENAVRLVVEDVKFDTDVIVSLFETNIRMLGGLLSGHILAEYLQLRADIMPWYRGELLDLAKDLGYRFLPAFNTTTGIPFGRINLRHGMKGVPAEMCRETCTACAGSMILEMAALSRLTGESIFEDKAQKAMDALWKMRHRGTDLMGSVLNVHSGDWVRRDSGVGAGIDSYYEYCLKAYILLGDEKYLGRFNKHYEAVMKYVSQGPMLLDVHMHRPNTNSKNFMDALLAFWPGLQVLKGDIKPAVETHEMLYQVMQRHNFIPEAFTTDFQVHWGHHPLRPEFLESTYFLYRATGDHYYLGVGRKVLKSLQTYARVTCGYAAVSDVRTNKHDDTMDSFVLSETFKYLFLLFAEPNDLVLDLDEFIFTTEGHLLPLTLAAVRTNVTADLDRDIVQVEELDRTCPNSLHLFPASVRQPLRNMVEDVCPRRSMKRRLNASQFQANNLEHLKMLGNMGITILTLADGRVQLLHTFSNARTAQDAEEGLLFMQEMVELSRKQSQQSETRPQFVAYVRNDMTPPLEVTLLAGPAHFGPGFKDGNRVTGTVVFANPSEACSDLVEPEKLVGKVVMVARGNCMFVEKAKRIQNAGAIAGIVLDTVVGSSASVSPMFAMSGYGKEPDDITIPVVFLFNKEATELVVSHIANDGLLTVTLGDFPRDEVQLKAPGDLSVFERLKGSLQDFLVRQMTSQNSGSTSRPVGAPATTEIESDAGPAIPVEYANLKALIYKDTGVVKIEKTGAAPAPTRSSSSTSQSLNNFEKTWHSMKQDLVNIIYSSAKPTFLVSIAKVQFQYKMVHKLRGLETILPVEKLSLWLLIRWLLKELSAVQPDPTLINSDVAKLEFANFPTKGEGTDGENAFQHVSLDDLIEKNEARDRELLMEINTMPKQLNTESLRPDVAAILEFRKDILRQMAAKTNDKVKEILAQNLHSNSPDFKLSADVEKAKAREEGVASEVNEDNQQTDVLKSISFFHLEATISKDRNLVKIGKTNFKSVATIPPNSIDNYISDYERNWYTKRLSFVNRIYADPENPPDITAELLKYYFLSVRMHRPNPSYRETESLENMVAWYLEELAEIQPDPSLIEVIEKGVSTQDAKASDDDDREVKSRKQNDPMEANEKVVPAEEIEDKEQTTVLSYAHLKATIFKNKGIVEFRKNNFESDATILPSCSDVSNSERISCDIERKYLVDFMKLQFEPRLEFSAETLTLQYLKVHMHRYTNENLEDIVLWFLKELSRAKPDVESVGEDVLLRWKQFEMPFNAESFAVYSAAMAALDNKFPNWRSKLTEAQIAVVGAMNLVRRKNPKDQCADNADKNEAKKDVDEVSMQQADNSRNQVQNDAAKDNFQNTETASRDNSHLEEIQSEEKTKNDDFDEAGDSLEELKKPVWAPDEDSSQSFSRQGKSDSNSPPHDAANDRNVEYQSEHSTKSRETKTREIGKRNDDEL